MMVRKLGAVTLFFAVAGLASAAPAPYTIKVADGTPPPMAFDRVRAETGMDTTELADALFDAVRRGHATMHLDPPPLGGVDVERPRISALARLQAADQKYCATLLGGVVELEGPVVRMLLRLADGSRDRDRLRSDLAASGAPLLAPQQLDIALRELAAMALIESG